MKKTVARADRPRLADHKIRPTVIRLTSRRALSSQHERGVRVVIAVASSLVCATMLQYILGAS